MQITTQGNTTTAKRKRKPRVMPSVSIDTNVLVQAAIAALEAHYAQHSSAALSSPSAVKDYLRLRLTGVEHEVFAVVFLDAQNRVLAYEEMFRGTLTQTSVHPREIVKRALHHNAGAVIFAHNHPSGVAEPSRADELLTQSLKHTLALVDVKTLDHFIVGAAAAMSFAEKGLL